MTDLGTIAGAVGLESAINLIWAGGPAITAVMTTTQQANLAALDALVPIDRLLTGRVPPSDIMPYVRLDPKGGAETARTNRSLYATERMEFHIWSDTFDAGRPIEDLIRDLFATIAFDWTTGAVLDMKWDGPSGARQLTEPELKAWQTTAGFTCRTWYQRQDTTSGS